MAKNVLLIFIDGLGLGQNNPDTNPLAKKEITLASKCRLIGHTRTSSETATIIPTDTTLGVDGIPQSATGQTTLLTGQNAPKVLGYHKSAYPNEPLKQLLARHSIFAQCNHLGYQATFANGFRHEYWDMIKKSRHQHSATTLSMLTAGLPLRYEDDYNKGDAIFHDITGHFLRTTGREVPYLSPRDAGKRLATITKNYHFTLFEFFMTDVLGHRKSMDPVLSMFDDLEAFISSTLHHLDLNESAVLLTSDHGNVEDLSTSAHTLNPVPTILYGPQAKLVADQITDLTDIVPAILFLLSRNGQ